MSVHRSRKSTRRNDAVRVERLENRALFSGYGFDPVAFVGAPTGGQAGDTFHAAGFEPAGINNNGTVAFAAYVNNKGSLIGEAVYTETNHQFTQLIRQGAIAPGGERYGGFGTFSPGSLNNNGDVAIVFGRNPFFTTLGVNAAVYVYSNATGKVIGAVVPDVTKSPQGGMFVGASFHASINDSGTTAFPGLVHTKIGPGGSGDLGQGIFTVDKNGHVSDVASPGDAAPGGKTFDFAFDPDINSAGDVAFGAHIAGEPVITLGQTFPTAIFAAESSYLKLHNGTIISIAHQGAAIPASAGGGTYDLAFGPVVNSSDQVVFIGSIRTPGITDQSQDPRGVFLYSGGTTIAVARPGTKLPGGGVVATASFQPSNYDINKNGEVVFNCTLTNGAEGIYAWNHGTLSLIAKTGTIVPGVGTINALDFFGTGSPTAGALNNDHGQVLFGATFKEGGGALMVATPGGSSATVLNSLPDPRKTKANTAIDAQRESLRGLVG